MNCYRPILVKPSIIGKPVWVPCGHCINCKKERSKAWAMRLILESFSWNDAAFVTLTYGDKVAVSQSGKLTLVKEHLQKFIKRLRFQLSEEGRCMMYYAVGEYGSHTFRPHYHAIIFGLSRSDLELVQKEWPYGFVRVDEMNLATCNYVAGYVQKKLYGDEKQDKYDGVLEPFSLMSKGISKRYFLENKERLLADGYILYKGRKLTLPRYYFKLMEPKSFLTCSDDELSFYGKTQDFKRQRRQYVDDVVIPSSSYIPLEIKEQRAKAAERLFDTRSKL